MSDSKKWWNLWDQGTASSVCGTKKQKMAHAPDGTAFYNTVPDIDGTNLSFDDQMTVSCLSCGWSMSGMHADTALLRAAAMHERNCPVERERRFSEAIERLTEALTKEKAP